MSSLINPSVFAVNGQQGDITLTKTDVGLGNVDNTSDATKNAAVATLTNKTLTSPVINAPTGLVKADVGLGNVDNTSDANKPVSTAQQTALNLKANLAGGNTFTGSQRIEGAELTLFNGANPALVLAASGGAGNSPSLEFKPFEGRTGGSSSRIVSVDNNFSSDIAFYNASTGDGANLALERMRLGANGQLSLGTATPYASAKLQIDSTTQGFLLPRMTSAQRLAIAAPAAGLMVYDTNLGCRCVYAGTHWTFEYDVITTAIQTTTSNVYTNITEFVTASLEPGLYAVRLRGIMQSTALTTGVGLRLAAGTATISAVNINWTFSQAAAGTDKNFEYSQLAVADNVTSASVVTANADFPVAGDGIVRISVAGTIAIQIRSEVNASGVSIRPNSSIILRKVGN